MTVATETQVADLISGLAALQQVLLEHRDELLAADRRIEDIIWPCEQHEHIGAAEFETRNTCLVAEPGASKLWVSRPALEDIVTFMPTGLQRIAADWFFVHQLVHVAQGLGYEDFRTLNRVGNRHETMRPDCDADFISLKTLAWLIATGKTAVDTDKDHSDLGYIEAFSYLLDVLVPHMMRLEPNIFMPRARDVEIKRLLALLIMRYYFAQSLEDDLPTLDGSIFPWWPEERDTLYVFVGQVHTLGRGKILVPPDLLDTVLALLRDGEVDAAYQRMQAINWPALGPAALPHRLLHEQVA